MASGHLAFSKDRKLHIPLLADFEPKGAWPAVRCLPGERRRVGAGVVRHRCQGIIRWSHVSPVGINPGADGILKALESMAKGGSV